MKDNIIIKELKRRSLECNDEIANKLFILADELINLAINHQKRVLQIMPEFDLHDNIHLKKVLDNIADLIGVEKTATLSNVELFLLITSSYLHDCGMAPSEWELKLMSLTEGWNDFKENELSICNDGRPPYTFKESVSFINNNKTNIYIDYDTYVKAWEFAESNEDDFVKSLAEFLIEYQEFRNGYISDIKKCNTNKNFKRLNNRIRIGFIRKRHHNLSYRYIINATSTFLSKIKGPWIKGLVSDLANICKSHGEDLSFVKKLLSDSAYQPNEVANLQFIAMMLRIGDICHYSEDRAPEIIKNGKLFDSKYSYNEWNVKSASVNYSIKNGTICFYAYCEDPCVYYKLQNYLNWIDEEINNLCSLQRKWEQKYQLMLNDVNRNGVRYDTNKFKPVPGARFTLQQNKIIQLLMGVGLYKNPHACLRELYQNAMDACKCKIYRERINGIEFKGRIEFGLHKENDKTFLYCLDNGIGMSERIIEKYLLIIGNSYYNSSDFFREQALSNSEFVPISQFGIGILSCFMIADRIEIITKENDSKKHIACCIDGPEEYFYYRYPTLDEESKITSSGTLVKLLLKEEYSTNLNDEPLEKPGLVMQYKRNEHFSKEFSEYEKYYDIWDKHIYNKLNDFICRTSPNIDVICKTSNGKDITILSKPFSCKIGDLGITDNDKVFIDTYLSRRRFCYDKLTLSDIQDYLIPYNVNVCVNDIEYNTIISMPLQDVPPADNTSMLFNLLKVNGCPISVDGIEVKNYSNSENNIYFDLLKQNGNLNYKGNNKPQLSVDRLQVVKMPTVGNEVYKQIAIECIEQIFSIAINHIKTYKLQDNTNIVNLIWKYIFDRISVADVLFINYLAKTELGRIQWPALNNIIKEEITICDFMGKQDIYIDEYDYNNFDLLTEKIVISKLLNAYEVFVDENECVKIKSNPNTKYPENDSRFRHEKYLVPVANTCDCFREFDIISNLYPIVPERLVKTLTRHCNVEVKNSNAVCVNNYSNNFTAFFDQDARLVHPLYGMYTKERNIICKPDTYIHSFDVRRHNILLMDFGFDKYTHKDGIMLLSYIAPRDLTEKDKIMIEQYRHTEPEYYKGVMSGWTILATGMDIDNVVIIPGKHTRMEMISHLSEEFWKKYYDIKFRFLDGTIVNQPL